jgi:hypothetical protein
MLLFPNMPSASSKAIVGRRPGAASVHELAERQGSDDGVSTASSIAASTAAQRSRSVRSTARPPVHAEGKQHEGGEGRQFEVEQVRRMALSARMKNTASPAPCGDQGHEDLDGMLGQLDAPKLIGGA